MELSLKNKNAIVCGSTQGIGESSAIELANLGANITLIARNESKLLNVLNELDKSQGQTHSFVCIDFSNTGKLTEEVNLLKDTYHILVNNTGGPASGPIADANTQYFEDAFRMHLINNQILVQKVVEGMKKEGFGRIVNIISTSVREPIPNIGLSNTLRGAMASWSKTLSRELPSCITINNVLPGFTDTDRLGSLAASINAKTGKSVEEVHSGWMSQVPIGRLIDPLETGAAIAYLCMPIAGGIRGVSLAVDGGRMRSI